MKALAGSTPALLCAPRTPGSSQRAPQPVFPPPHTAVQATLGAPVKQNMCGGWEVVKVEQRQGGARSGAAKRSQLLRAACTAHQPLLIDGLPSLAPRGLAGTRASRCVTQSSVLDTF